MAPFLSRSWVTALGRAAEAATVDPEVRLTIRQVVGDVRWTIRLEAGRVTVDPDDDGEPDVTLVTDRRTAEALVRGELGTQDALLVGRLRLRGDVAALLQAAPALAALPDLFAAVRTDTTYER